MPALSLGPRKLSSRNKPRNQLLKKHPEMNQIGLMQAVIKIVNGDAALAVKQAQVLDFVDGVAAVVAKYAVCKQGKRGNQHAPIRIDPALPNPLRAMPFTAFATVKNSWEPA